MIAALLPFLRGPGLTALKWLAIAGAVLAVLLGAKNAGKTAEQVEHLRRENDDARERMRAEVAVRGLSDDALDDELRPPGRRRKSL